MASCETLLAAYHNVTRGADCPNDRHLIEELYYRPACAKPSVRLCRTRTWAMVHLNGTQDVLRRVNRTVDWENFKPLRHIQDAADAANHGTVPGLPGAPKGTPWGAKQFSVDHWRDRFTLMLKHIYEGAFRIPLSETTARATEQRQVHTVLDVGGGAGVWCAALRDTYGATCVTLTQDNAPASNAADCNLEGSGDCRTHLYDLPFNEMAVELGLITLLWSGADRLPLPDGSLDLINSEGAIVNFLSEDDAFTGILYDWDRLLRVGGHIVIRSPLDVPGHSFSRAFREAVQVLHWEKVFQGRASPREGFPSRSESVV